MATNVKVITAYCDLGLTKRSASEFHEHGNALIEACGKDIHVYNYKPQDCWTWPYYGFLPPANARALDRFATDQEHLQSNLIQHAPVQMLEQAYYDFPKVDVFAWLGYSILKQGDFTGRRITPDHISAFVRNLKTWKALDLPFPGMWPYLTPIAPLGDNWRFCGSTIVVPRQFIVPVVRSYKANFQAFLSQHFAIPLDLAIWPMVEFTSGLPWRWYPAEYDYTQLTNFPFGDRA